jgi:hypothetical protein
MVTPPPVAAIPPPALPPLAPANPDLVAALTGFTQARENPVRSPYLPFELRSLLELSGNDPPFDAMTEDFLPGFWREVKPFRRSSTRSRALYKWR